MKTIKEVIDGMGLGLNVSEPSVMEAIVDYADVVLYVNKVPLTPASDTGLVSAEDMKANYDAIGLIQSNERTYQRGVGEVGEIGSEGGVTVVNQQTKTMNLTRILHRKGSLLAQVYQSVLADDDKFRVFYNATKPIFRKNKFHMIMEIYDWDEDGEYKTLKGKILYQGCKMPSLGTSITWRENISMENATIVWDKTHELEIPEQ